MAACNQVGETFTFRINVAQSCRNENPRVAPPQEDQAHVQNQAPMHLVGLVQLELPQFSNRGVGIHVQRQVVNETESQQPVQGQGLGGSQRLGWQTAMNVIVAVLSWRRGIGTTDDPQASAETIEPRNEPHPSQQRGNYHN